eukprot:1458845-Pleurochrysis_carterae.AAC.1
MTATVRPLQTRRLRRHLQEAAARAGREEEEDGRDHRSCKRCIRGARSRAGTRLLAAATDAWETTWARCAGWDSARGARRTIGSTASLRASRLVRARLVVGALLALCVQMRRRAWRRSRLRRSASRLISRA